MGFPPGYTKDITVMPLTGIRHAVSVDIALEQPTDLSSFRLDRVRMLKGSADAASADFVDIYRRERDSERMRIKAMEERGETEDEHTTFQLKRALRREHLENRQRVRQARRERARLRKLGGPVPTVETVPSVSLEPQPKLRKTQTTLVVRDLDDDL